MERSSLGQLTPDGPSSRRSLSSNAALATAVERLVALCRPAWVSIGSGQLHLPASADGTLRLNDQPLAKEQIASAVQTLHATRSDRTDLLGARSRAFLRDGR